MTATDNEDVTEEESSIKPEIQEIEKEIYDKETEIEKPAPNKEGTSKEGSCVS